MATEEKELLSLCREISEAAGKTVHKPFGGKPFEAAVVPWPLMEKLREMLECVDQQHD